jgi:hypothetical protein
MIRESTNRCGARARAGVALLALLLLPALAQGQQSVAEKYQRARQRQSTFNLSAGPSAVLKVNKFQCGLTSAGATCTDVFNSPTGGGGFWPTGSPDQYMFNSGLQIAGIIPADANFEWAGDTVGALFMDAAGSRTQGTKITDIYDSLDPEDIANWPDKGDAILADFPESDGAWVRDTRVNRELFNDVLIGRKAASQQDSWVMYWDGDPDITAGRDHPMGILVEQRTLAWNYPTGNESIIYLIYKFTNVTNNALFQRLSEAKFFGGANMLPDEGWRFDSIYATFDSDPDVTTDAGQNHASGIMPFSLGIAYHGLFYYDAFDYPPDLFYPPFFTSSPGIVGMKFLKSPVDPATDKQVGLTALSMHTNGGAFHDPSNVQQLWRYTSLNTDPNQDPSCSFPKAEVKDRRACYLGQTLADVRLFIASGPFSLGPGESTTIAVAMYAAATVNTPLINVNADNKPGVPSVQPGCNGNPIRPIEVAAGWVATRTSECPVDPNEVLDQYAVDVVPNSLLGKALVAQSIFDNKFLLGFSPETPPFYLVPGDNQVTVVWEPSATETEGDPFFVAAGDPQSALYDPNYRQFDVEGYRIYRGTTAANFELVAQFDFSGTKLVDRICATDETYVQGDTCDPDSPREIDLTGAVVQYPLGGVVRLADGTPLVVKADTAFQDLVNAGRAKSLSDTGVPYSWIDTSARNGIQYFYKVTAFDINSERSGPTSLESAGPSKFTTPRGPATSIRDAKYTIGLFGRGSEPLSTVAPTIDPTTGVFSGPAGATELISPQMTAFAAQLLPAGVSSMTIDSVKSIYNRYNRIGVVTYVSGGGSQSSVTFDDTEVTYTKDLPPIPVASDPTAQQALIAKGVDAPPLSGTISGTISIGPTQFHSGDADWAPNYGSYWSDVPGDISGGSRWFTGDNETMADPTLGRDSWGDIPGYVIFQPDRYNTSTYTSPLTGGNQSSAYARRFMVNTMGVRRAADVKLYWGAAGLDSVVDVTHDVLVPRVEYIGAGYGFIGDSDADGVITYGDFYYIPGLEHADNIGGLSSNNPRPLLDDPVIMNTSTDGDMTGDGNGFGLYINGEWYLFGGPMPTSQVWTLRTYNGAVTQTDGVYSFEPTTHTPAIPGLRIAVNVEAPAVDDPAAADLSKVHTVPDPYYAVSLFDFGPQGKVLKFVNLPSQATIRIYSMSGVLVTVLNHDDPSGGSAENWNLRNKSNQFVGSGVYFYHVSTPDGKSHVGKFTVINSGFAR